MSTKLLDRGSIAGLLDPSICSTNSGDQIIMEAVNTEISRTLEGMFVIRFPTQEYLGARSRRLLARASLKVLGGTNLLSSNMHIYNQWKINLVDMWRLREVVLLGVGWWQYQDDPNLYTRTLLRRVLSSGWLHSVRDNYTREKLEKIGIRNVINTGCPTLWPLTERHCDGIPRDKGQNVVFTLTDYSRDATADRALIEQLSKTYAKAYFWPQGADDLDYLRDLDGVERVSILPPGLRAFNGLLESDLSLDYVGTRLHAGIKALNAGRRTIILAVDNRALEMGRDVGLNVVDRTSIAEIERMLTSTFRVRLEIDFESIETWRRQFRQGLANS